MPRCQPGLGGNRPTAPRPWGWPSIAVARHPTALRERWGLAEPIPEGGCSGTGSLAPVRDGGRSWGCPGQGSSGWVYEAFGWAGKAQTGPELAGRRLE